MLQGPQVREALPAHALQDGRCSERPRAQEEGPEHVSSLGTCCALCLPPPRVCPLRPGWSKLTVFWQMLPWQPSAHGWWVLCQELRKQGCVGSGGGRPGTCSKEAGPHLSQGVGTGCGATSGRLQTHAHDSSHVDQTMCQRPPKRWCGPCRCCRDERNTNYFRSRVSHSVVRAVRSSK